ncbi:MAG: cell division protein ZapA [Proteiniphilum sp.]|nr:cell division protein ZapA [Proteiniphilum sp.]
MSDDKLLITLRVDGRVFPLRINRSEEEVYRKAAKVLDDKLNRYKISYGDNPELSTIDLLIMSAIQVLGESYTEYNKIDPRPYENTIGSLIEELNNYLK